MHNNKLMSQEQVFPVQILVTKSLFMKNAKQTSGSHDL